MGDALKSSDSIKKAIMLLHDTMKYNTGIDHINWVRALYSCLAAIYIMNDFSFKSFEKDIKNLTESHKKLWEMDGL